MATETRSSGTQADDSGVGTLTWSNPSNAAASDNSYSTVSGGPGTTSHYHKSTNFGFTTIGDSDTLTQLKLRFERKKSSGGTIKDFHVYLVVGGTIQTGTDYADTSTAYPSSDTYAEYTITTGLPTVAQLKASGFGCVLTCKDSSGFPWGVDLDHTEIVATYTPVVAYTATAAATAGPATASATCTFAPKCTGSAAPSTGSATCAASAAFASAIYTAAASPIAGHAAGAASASYTPPVFTASAAPIAGHATAAASCKTIQTGTAALSVPHATCAAAMAYTPPTFTGSAAKTLSHVSGEGVGQTWRRGAWRYQCLTLHDG